MDIVVILFLTSGLFLGWSLGANDAANVFGTAVGTRMVRFSTAALVCGIFVILGAVFSGAGAANTLGTLGSVNALAGSFVAALSAALTVYLMTRLGLPVSTSQAIVGAIIGWNLFSGSVTDSNTLFKILGTWVACPLLAGLIAAPLHKITQQVLGWAQFHLLRLDAYTRAALIFAGAFGSYSLGANNIANVMGVFVEVSPFTDFDIGGMITFTGIQQLFLIGAIAIGVGVFTYSKKVMLTVGTSLVPLSPVAAWVVVIAHSIVLFLFASEGLEFLLANSGLPTIPLVPVSSSQAVVGAVVGIGILKGGKNIDWKILGNIGAGWITTPVISAVVCFVALFFMLFGTILGGIWADQSWGRFWGWDPKENAALMIVMWQLLMVHLRISGWIKPLGFAFGMIINNIFLAFGWFGVNLLGVGLHSYGFTDSIATNLYLFIIFELWYGIAIYYLIKDTQNNNATT